MKTITLELYQDPPRYKVLSVNAERYEVMVSVNAEGDVESTEEWWLTEKLVQELCADPEWTVHVSVPSSDCRLRGHHTIPWRDENGGYHSYCDRCSRWLCCNGQQIGFR